MIIDFHAHVFPDELAPRAMARLQSTSHHACYTDGTADGLRKSMQQAGIDYSVVLPVVTNPEKAKRINDISIANKENNGLIYFGGIHPNTEYWYEELGRLAAAGVKGFKIHPVSQGVDIDDIRYLRILERAAELGLIVVMHAGDDPSFPGHARSNPEKTRNALLQVPNVTFVAAHMGGEWNWDRVEDQLADTCTYLDTSNSLGRREKIDNYHPDSHFELMNEEEFCHLVKVFGKERILFAADSPWGNQVTYVKQVAALPLDPETFDHIFYKNACRLLNLQY